MTPTLRFFVSAYLSGKHDSARYTRLAELQGSTRTARARLVILCFVVTAVGGFFPTLVNGQVVPAFRDTSLASQVTGVVQYTFTDYALATATNRLDRVRLLGGAVEYTDRRFRPLGIIGRTSYGAGTVLGQKLFASEVGVEYYRRAGHFAPFGEVMVGLARTSSTDYQYLYSSSAIGLAATAAAGMDYHAHGPIGIRLLQVQGDHYSFGVQGSTSLYWTFSAGAFYSFGHR